MYVNNLFEYMDLLTIRINEYISREKVNMLTYNLEGSIWLYA